MTSAARAWGRVVEYSGGKVTDKMVKRKDFVDNRNTEGLLWFERFCTVF